MPTLRSFLNAIETVLTGSAGNTTKDVLLIKDNPAAQRTGAGQLLEIQDHNSASIFAVGPFGGPKAFGDYMGCYKDVFTEAVTFTPWGGVRFGGSSGPTIYAGAGSPLPSSITSWMTAFSKTANIGDIYFQESGPVWQCTAAGTTGVPNGTWTRNSLGGIKVFNAVTDYGLATTNTGTQNRTALQNCINDAAAAKGTAYIPAGQWHISGGALTVPAFARVAGDSMYGTVIIQDTTNTDVFQVMGADSSHIITGAELRDMTIHGPGQASGSTGVGLNLNWADDTNVFERLLITANGSHGVFMQNSYVLAFRDCWFYANGGDGFNAVTSVNAASFDDCEFGWNTGNGGYFSGIAGAIWDGCDIESNGMNGLWLVNCYAEMITGSDFENNGTSAANTYDGLRIDHTQGYAGPTVVACNFTGTSGVTRNGVSFIAATSAYISGCPFNNFGTADIVIDAASTGVVIGPGVVHEAGAGTFVADSGAGTTYIGQRAASGSVALTDAATITVDASRGNYFRVTLGGARTLANPTNPVNGQMIVLEVIQDATGSRTLSYGAAYAFSAGIPQPTLTTTAGKRDFLLFMYNSTAALWYLLAFTNGF